MGSGFGLDGARSVKNNDRSYKRKSAFTNRGDTPYEGSLTFENENALSKDQLKALGDSLRKKARIRLIRNLFLTLLLAAIAFIIAQFIFF